MQKHWLLKYVALVIGALATTSALRDGGMLREIYWTTRQAIADWQLALSLGVIRCPKESLCAAC